MVRGRKGATWVEILLVSAISAIFMMLVLQAKQYAMEYERRTSCLDNMRKLATAHNQFANLNDRYCGYVNSVGSDKKRASWVVPLFPYIDRLDLSDAWAKPNAEPPRAYVEELLCPTNPPLNEKIGPLCYIVNGGYAGDKQPECEDADCTTLRPGTGENPANGVFYDQYEPSQGFNPQIARTISIPYLAAHDGASRTLMLSENVQWVTTWYTTTEDRAPLAFVWYQTSHDPNDADSAARRINSLKLKPTSGRLDFARPSSYHPQGVNAAFCDGHGKFISESIDYRVYKQSMTSASEDSDDKNPGVYDENWHEFE